MIRFVTDLYLSSLRYLCPSSSHPYAKAGLLRLGWPCYRTAISAVTKPLHCPLMATSPKPAWLATGLLLSLPRLRRLVSSSSSLACIFVLILSLSCSCLCFLELMSSSHAFSSCFVSSHHLAASFCVSELSAVLAFWFVRTCVGSSSLCVVGASSLLDVVPC